VKVDLAFAVGGTKMVSFVRLRQIFHPLFTPEFSALQPRAKRNLAFAVGEMKMSFMSH
jgi:hypothetical protein